jgi:hypothetical protein
MGEDGYQQVLTELLAQPHEGRVAIGPGDNQVLLGQLSAALSSAERGIEELLVQVAGDEQSRRRASRAPFRG